MERKTINFINPKTKKGIVTSLVIDSTLLVANTTVAVLACTDWYKNKLGEGKQWEAGALAGANAMCALRDGFSVVEDIQNLHTFKKIEKDDSLKSETIPLIVEG